MNKVKLNRTENDKFCKAKWPSDVAMRILADSKVKAPKTVNVCDCLNS